MPTVAWGNTRIRPRSSKSSSPFGWSGTESAKLSSKDCSPRNPTGWTTKPDSSWKRSRGRSWSVSQPLLCICRPIWQTPRLWPASQPELAPRLRRRLRLWPAHIFRSIEMTSTLARSRRGKYPSNVLSWKGQQRYFPYQYHRSSPRSTMTYREYLLAGDALI